MARLLATVVTLLVAAAGADLHRPRLRAQGVPDVPEPSCAYCGQVGGGNPNCPHCGGGGGSEPEGGGSSSSASPAPIFVAPVGIIGGLFTGGHWFYSEMAGRYPDKSFLSSYLEHQRFQSDDPGFDSALSFGLFVGGLPWLAVYPAGWTVKTAGQGVAAGGTEVARAFTPPDPTPVVRQYAKIAEAYGQLAAEAEGTLAKQRARTEAARAACDAHLDRFVREQPDLREMAAVDPAGARSRARARLDACAQALVGRRQANALGEATARELQEARDEALAPLRSQIDDVLKDLPAAAREGEISAALAAGTLSSAEALRLKSEKLVLEDVKSAKGWLETASGAKELYDSYEEARDDGAEFGEWVRRRETVEKLGRLALGLLGEAGETAEKSLDLSYAATAEIVLAGKIARIRNEIRRLDAMSSRNDLIGQAWLDRVGELQACEQREASTRKRKERYEEEKADYEQKARRLQG